MSAVRTRFSTPVQIFILMFYIVLVLVVKHYYDNNQRNKRFQQYDMLIREVAGTLDMVEKHAKETAQAVKAIEVSMAAKEQLLADSAIHKLFPQHFTSLQKSQPP